MDVIFIALGALCMVAGIVGAILPVIPGPPLAYLGLWFLQWSSYAPFSGLFLSVWAVIALGVTVLDYVVPVWGTRKFGGSQAGVRGSTIGLLLGLFAFPPWGIVLGPFLGAMVAELLVNVRAPGKAFKSGLGSLVGFLLGTGLKLGVGLVMAVYFVQALV
jgi:uncharacterized protein YqgC (DUF456 family)